MIDSLRSIERILEARFGKMQARALVCARARLVHKDVQFMDVKHLSELCERYRSRARIGIAAYRGWQHKHALENDAIARLYGAAEGAALHRMVSDDVKLWYMAQRDYHTMRRAYLLKCMGPRAGVEWQKAA